MSSLYVTGYSSFAFDRNTDGYDGCAHTGLHDLETWWMVDLVKTYIIHSLTITNRYGFCKYKEFQICIF